MGLAVFLVSAQRGNGLLWHVSDQLKLVRTPQSARWFITIPTAKLAVEEALAQPSEGQGKQC